MNIYRGLSALPEFKNSVITIGSFDGVHQGHYKILKRLQQLAEASDGVDVVITFHPHPREIVYPKDNDLRILTTLDEKLEYFRKAGVSNVVIVPFTIEFSQQPAVQYIEQFLVARFNPGYIVIGYDHQFGFNRAGNVHLLEMYSQKHNYQVVRIEEEEIKNITISSTKIRRALQANDIEYANRLLGHPYLIRGRVVTGNRLGHHIGFPTANVEIADAKKLLPADGIFAATATIAGIEYKGMLYIGLRPSIDAEEEHRVEMHLFDFDRQIYDQDVSIELFKFIRPDRKFPNMEELKLAMEADELAVREYFQTKDQNTAEVATVILNYNGKSFLERFLPFFDSNRFPRQTTYLIDNASSDGSVKWVKTNFPNVHCITLTENHGYAGGYNEGLANIHEKYLALVNSDIEITPEWLTPIIDMMEADESIAAVQPKILSETRRSYFEYAGAAGGYMDLLGYPFCRGRILHNVERDTHQYQSSEPIFWASGAAMVIRNDVFQEMGGFDKDYFAHQEEIDLAWRMLLSNNKIMVCPDSVVYHVGGGTMSYSSPQKIYLNFRNNLITLIKYLPSANLFPVLLIRWILDTLAGIRFVLKFEPANAFTIVRAHFYIYGHLMSLIRKRKEVSARFSRRSLRQLPGVYKGSIIFAYYLQWKHKFSDLFRDEKQA